MKKQAKAQTGETALQAKVSPIFLFQTVVFISCLIVSNLIAVKLIHIGPFVLPAAIIVFPITYIFGDVLTEVYGYERTRQVIWLGFLSNLLIVLFIKLAEILPAASFWQSQAAYSAILGYSARVLAASFVAYLVGEFLNSFILSKIKLLTKGRILWARTIGSTLVGQLADSIIFISIAFAGIVPFRNLLTMVLIQWMLKVFYEALLTPVTYIVVRAVKTKEGIDTYDYKAKYNPFKLSPMN